MGFLLTGKLILHKLFRDKKHLLVSAIVLVSPYLLYSIIKQTTNVGPQIPAKRVQK